MKIVNWTLSGVFAALALAAGAEDAAFSWPASGTATIPAGTTVTVTDADRAAMDACSAIAFADATARLVLETAKGPQKGVAITGAGTIVKKGTGGWILETTLGFTGTWDLEAGVVTNASSCGLGSTDSGAGDVIVRRGAALVTTYDDPQRYRTLRLAGAGPDGRGAWICAANDTSGILSRLVLDEDAVLRIDASYAFFQSKNAAGRIDLNGHTLTKVGTGTPYFISGSSVNGGRYVVAEGAHSARGAFAWDPAAEIVLTNKVNYQIFNDSANYAGQLTVAGTNIVYHAHQFHRTDTKGTPVECPQNASKNFFTGPVVLTNAASLLQLGIANNDDMGENMGVTGPVSGPGSIEVFPSAYNYGRVTFGNPSNTFTGSLTLKPGVNAGVRFDLVHSNAVPNYAQVTVADGWLCVRPGATGWDWCADSIARFGATANFTGTGVFSVDTSACADERLTLSGAAIDAALAQSGRDAARYGHEGAGDLTIAGPLAGAVRYSAYSGVVRFTGTGPVNVQGGHASAAHLATGRVEIADCTYAQFTNFPLYVGAAYGASELRIVDSTVGGAPTNYTNSSTEYAWVPGCMGYPGVLSVSGASVVTAKVVVAKGSDAAQGAVYQTGGEVNLLAMEKDSYGSTFLAMDGHGYYELRGGTARLLGFGGLAYYGRGVLAQYGGRFMTTNHPSYAKTGMNSFWNMPYGNGGRAHHYVRSGTTELFGNVLLARDGNAEITVDGPDALFDASSQGVSFGYSRAPVAQVNLCRGGTVKGHVVARYKKNGASDSYETNGWRPKFYVNANGGRWFSARECALGWPWDDCADGVNPGVTRVTVYPAGLVYGVKDKYTDTLRQPLLAPTGKGVASIPWTARAGYVGSPYVEITGDGTGAAAFAEFDSASGQVTGIRVLSPGFDYTWAKAKILGGMGRALTSSPTNCWLEIDCELADNAATGGLTMEGPGTLQLAATNTFTGTTVVKGGTVKLAAADRLHPQSALELAGGAFDANGFAQTFRAIGGASGKLLNAANVTAAMAAPVNTTTAALDFGALADGISVTGAWTIDLADAKAGRHPVYAANLTFAATATLAIANLDLANPADGGYDLLETAAGYAITGKPTLACTLPAGWTLVQSGRKLSLRFPTGMAVLVR